MIAIESRVHVNGMGGAQVVDFMLNCTDEQYQAWWPGTHLAFHTVKRRPGDVGNLVYMDEFVGSRRIKMRGVVTEIVPGRKTAWQFSMLLRMPARLILEVRDDEDGAAITHTLRAGLGGLGRILDPLFRLYFSAEFAAAMEEHAQAEFPMLGAMLSGIVERRG
jgi:hypothetical protein